MEKEEIERREHKGRQNRIERKTGSGTGSRKRGERRFKNT